MQWWHPLVALADLYLLLSLGPWLLLQYAEWRLRKRVASLAQEREHLEEVRGDLQLQEGIWPRELRPGPYREPDERARGLLAILRDRVESLSALLPPSPQYASRPLRLWQVLALQSWGRLRLVTATWRQLAEAGRYLDDADDALDVLREEERTVALIPERTRGMLSQQRAEISRLIAIVESECEHGTEGLEPAARRLEELTRSVEYTLGQLGEAAGERLPRIVEQADRLANAIAPAFLQLDEEVSGISDARQQARNALERVRTGVALAEERWRGLHGLGATEPIIFRALAALRSSLVELHTVATVRTPESYRELLAGARAADEQLAQLSSSIDALAALMQRSKDSIAGDVRRLSKVQADCEALSRDYPFAVPDESLALMEQTAAGYLEAERHHGLGTFEGYERAGELSAHASEFVSQAEAARALFAERIPTLLGLLESVTPEAVRVGRERLAEAREALAPFAWHWENGLAEKHEQASAALDGTAQELAALPPDIRELRALRQSEVGAALATLERALDRLEQAADGIAYLDREHGRLSALRAEYEATLDALRSREWPELEALSHQMLSERAEALKSLYADFRRGADARRDPAQINYDEAAGEWLPAILDRVDAVREAHKEDVARYRWEAREVARTLQRAWSRLERLDPFSAPTSEEDVGALADDLEDWRVEVEREKNSPAFLAVLVGRTAHGLEERIERARRQIIEGRRATASLARKYRQLSAGIQGLRSDVRDLRRDSQWPRLSWDMGSADSLWERTVGIERSAEATPTLVEAADRLQRAIHSAEEAEAAYLQIRREVESALRRLDDELAEIQTALLRAQRQVEQLTEQGLGGEADAILDLASRARELVGQARAASTFEEALRHLRDAKNWLARL